MPSHSIEPVTNRLINSFDAHCRDRLLDMCTLIDLEFGDVIEQAGDVLDHVYFPQSGFISMVASLSDHKPIEMYMVGNEGMVGATLALGVETTPMQGLVQAPGTAFRADAKQFQKLLDEAPEMTKPVDRYLYIIIEQLAQTAACNSFHEVRERLARCLLMTHDRVEGDSFYLTHSFLAGMLGVRRSAVTIAAGELQSRGLISYSRGQIRVISRSGLEEASCECYSASQASFNHWLPKTLDTATLAQKVPSRSLPE